MRVASFPSIVAAVALLGKDADKIAMRQELTLTTSHAIQGVLNAHAPAPDLWVSNARLVHYQSLLLNLPCVKYHLASTLILATLLPILDLDVIHGCSTVLSHIQNPRLDRQTDRHPQAVDRNDLHYGWEQLHARWNQLCRFCSGGSQRYNIQSFHPGLQLKKLN